MAVTIIKRPQGHILDTTQRDALVTDDYGNQGALFDDPNHGLVDGNYVFITSDVENYNGFWYVEQINSRFFWLREYATGSLLQWVVDATVTYYKVDYTHGWSCVHLPIVYKLSNNRWPTNSIDTARTISNVTDSNGYCNLTVSGDIKASGSANELDYVKVSTGALAGIYQIISWSSDTSFVINALYSAANDTALTGATIQYYYNNYNVRVRVFAGLSSSHALQTQKPYAQVVDLKLVPDSSGIVEVNINEYLKSKLKPLSNNLQLATLPNDIDSFCQFYISTAETYDETDGETQTTSTPSFTADSSNFEGVAVNAMLQFKNRYSGYLSEYLAYDSRSKFLTLFDRPVIFAGCYFDIGFLLGGNGAILKKEFYNSSDVLSWTEEDAIPQYGLGLYRREITIPSSPSEKRVDLSLFTNLNILATEGVAINSEWTNVNYAGTGTPGTNWTLGAAPYVAPNGGLASLTTDTTSKYAVRDLAISVIEGVTYTLDMSWRTTAITSTKTYTVYVVFLDASNNELASDSYSATASVGTGVSASNVFTLVGTFGAVKLAVRVKVNSFASGSFSFSAGNFEDTDDTTLSETKTIDINTDCSQAGWAIYLTWKNYLGGMDYWKFTSGKEYITDVEGTTETTNNLLPTWPNSYGEFADTIDKETSRTSRDKLLIRSQNVTEDQMNGIRYIVSSPLVQIMVSKSDRRTVKVTPGSFTWKRDEDKLYNIEMEISFTNTIPSQSL